MYRSSAFQLHLEEERVEQPREQSVVMMMMAMPETAETSVTTKTSETAAETSETAMSMVMMMELTGHLQVIKRLNSNRLQRLHLGGQGFNLGHWHGHHAAHVRQVHQQHQLF